MTVLCVTHPKGRKQHVCEDCRHNIPVGEKHTRVVQVVEGSIYEWRAHDDCMEAGRQLALRVEGDIDNDGRAQLFLAIADNPEHRDWLKETFPAVYARLFPLDVQSGGAA